MQAAGCSSLVARWAIGALTHTATGLRYWLSCARRPRHAHRKRPSSQDPDPFDRLLLAQAIRHGMVLVSIDAVFDGYGVNRLW